jgi:uncharacterized protein
VKILSLSGGGLKGAITLGGLSELERQLGALNEAFDLIAGTSVGGLLACGLSAGLTCGQLAELMGKLGPEVFRPRWGRGYVNPKYKIDDLRGAVLRAFGDRGPRGRAKLIVNAYELTRGEPWVLKWHDNPLGLSLEDFACATCAAPTYFSSYPVGGLEFTDGGVFSNNPSREAATEAVLLGASLDDIRHLSLGAGYVSEGVGRTDWGVLQWVLKPGTPLIKVFIDGATEVAAKTSGAFGRYKHYDVLIDKEHNEIDKPEFLPKLFAYGALLGNKLAQADLAGFLV